MTSKKNIYDVIIVGAGPAGLTAAIYTSRRTLKTLVLSKDIGGQVNLTTKIENYPGIELTDGITLAQTFAKQAKKFGAEILSQEVKNIKKGKGHFKVITSEKEFLTKTIILAFGLTPKTLDVPGEEEYTGRGVSYCATCDAPLFHGKVVAVVGGGNAALDAALLLSKISKQVYLIHRSDSFRGDEITQKKLKQAKNVKIILNSNIKQIKGKNFVESIIVNIENKKEKEIIIDGIFIEIGHMAKTQWLKGVVDLNGNNEIAVKKDRKTSTSGIFACGDVADTPDKQIIIAAGQGAQAGLQAYKYISQLEGTETADWD